MRRRAIKSKSLAMKDAFGRHFSDAIVEERMARGGRGRCDMWGAFHKLSFLVIAVIEIVPSREEVKRPRQRSSCYLEIHKRLPVVIVQKHPEREGDIKGLVLWPITG